MDNNKSDYKAALWAAITYLVRHKDDLLDDFYEWVEQEAGIGNVIEVDGVEVKYDHIAQLLKGEIYDESYEGVD